MPAHVLRDYQQRGLKQVLDAYRDGARSVLMVLATGGGKTSVFGSLVAQLDAKGKRSLILAHRRELVSQASNRLREFDVSHGVILAGVAPRPFARAQIASVQTLSRRSAPQADLVVCDEAHLSTATTWASIIEQYPKARILGVTATPWRLSGKPLAGAYDARVVVATPRELREQGYLCEYNGFSYKAPDLEDVRTTGGDYDERDAAKAMSASVIVDDIVEQWQQHASHLSTVVFAVTVEHSRQLVERFRAAGVAAEHLDGNTPLAQREAIMRRVANGTTRVLSNVGTCIEGLDIPRLKCCVLARPTMSLARAIQMMGRVRRPWEGVTARIHDHAFVLQKHGLPDQDRDYTLNAKPEAPPSLATCPACLALYTGTRCPACDLEKAPEPQGPRVIQTITDAEQYHFSSAEEPALPADTRPPVKVSWDTVGRMVEGIFVRQWEVQESYGWRKHYELKGAKRTYHLPGTKKLDALMATRKTGERLRVHYTGETPSRVPGQRARKEFKVEVDDGEPEPDREALKDRAVAMYQEGKSIRGIARTLGIDKGTTQQWLRTRGVALQSLPEAHGADLETRSEVVRRYTAGESTPVIAKALGMNPSAASRHLAAAGVTRRSLLEAQGTHPEHPPEAVRRYQQGETGAAIAKSFGVHPTAVYRWLEAAGVERRPPGSAPRTSPDSPGSK